MKQKKKLPKTRFIGRDHSQARLHRQKQWRRVRWYALGGGVFLILVGILYVLIYSSIFQIQSIQIESPSQIDSAKLLTKLRQQVQQTKLGALLGSDHYFSWWTNRQHYQLPSFVTITVTKKLRAREVLVKAVPRAKFGSWCQETNLPELEKPQEDCYWIDQAGLVFENGPILEGQMIPAIYENSSSSPKIAIGEPILEEDAFTIIRSIIPIIRALNISATKIIFDRAASELHVQTNAGATLLFSTRFDPENTALPALIRIQKNPGLKNLEYVNLTVENRAFYKVSE
ncbi:MAG: hypothetical protein COU11_01580 [Candidatus Harrisonbacteria bacterium CG10_big_fil_rev_8_21_14_0_10_49_15]|uniref:POTRA domain-containing protein n=1 Tax=Candidatus Harrisonbacteria bacterium CG10_big_fil_rev_8_21_14_0_10_49_15 TaxID=1974587 RepID=A0A2H0UNI3_9BACT|nr:MAG: hypothetical protein COU11_01580 [Candidatus Harrisonbacteria bacterium CG10_big_fil_rev_8_21_14_0_10_49_15]